MSKQDELEFIESLLSQELLWDNKKLKAYIEEANSTPNLFFRGIGDMDTNNQLKSQFYNEYKYLLADSSLEKINGLLTHKAKTDGIKQRVYLRVAKRKYIYINLGTGRIAKITPKGVSICEKAPVKFEIHNSLGEMKSPNLNDGDVNYLKKYIRVKEGDFKLILVYIFNTFFTDTHYLLLALIGPAGSGKSFAQKVIKTVTDPSIVMLRNNITNPEDLALAAIHCHVVDLNNVSKLTDSIQDNLCTTLTGGVTTTRTKFTSKEQTSIHTHNPVIINGIGNFITRDDLYERALVIYLKKISGSDYSMMSESQLLDEFKKDLPMIMGGIFNALSNILLEYDDFVAPDNLNRMADFHILGLVTEKALHWKTGSFERAYNANITAAQDDVIECSIVAQAIINLNQAGKCEFEGTYIQLKEKLSRYGDLRNINPKRLSTELDRINGALLNLHGIKITKLTRSNNGRRLKISII